MVTEYTPGVMSAFRIMTVALDTLQDTVDNYDNLIRVIMETMNEESVFTLMSAQAHISAVLTFNLAKKINSTPLEVLKILEDTLLEK